MRKHRLLIAVSALSLASLAIGPQAFAREREPGDDHGHATVLAAAYYRDTGQQIEPGDDRGRDGQGEVEARRGADDPAGDDRGVDPQPHD